jgi:putative RNA 2'-phosphotransferase
VEAILRDGLRPMGRRHVHLSPDAATARRVGARHGRPEVLEVAAGDLAAAGHVFLRSDNGVWLTDRVPPWALKVVPAPR